MKVFKHIAPLKAFLKDQRRAGKTVGLVPTMGALHPGHLALIEASKKQNDLTVSSIYVNPTQFNNASDLAKYPRTLQLDASLLEKVGCDVLFTPDNDEMYSAKSLIRFDFSHLDKVMEGKFRPGHFSGVALVVSKFFNIVNPDQAYFGQKDFQQFAIIRQLVSELQFDITLHCVSTLRESDGLAMSSRNLRLNLEERKAATVFYRALTAVKDRIRKGETLSDAKQIAQDILHAEPLARLEYFELADSENLNVLESVSGADRAILCVAGFIGEVRLIDNMFLD